MDEPENDISRNIKSNYDCVKYTNMYHGLVRLNNIYVTVWYQRRLHWSVSCLCTLIGYGMGEYYPDVWERIMEYKQGLAAHVTELLETNENAVIVAPCDPM